MNEYDFETGRVIKEVRKAKAKTVGLQFPEGLKVHALEIAGEIENETGATCIIFTDPTYGACDTKDEQAKKLGIDLLVHYGHTSLLKKC
ncbi:MAG: diphthamide synthesis protein [Candidatus Altiarchaeota archaeon]|nr:diphthamide synthesis protein [Candidatus Altiarchaeota archaeon]